MSLRICPCVDFGKFYLWNTEGLGVLSLSILLKIEVRWCGADSCKLPNTNDLELDVALSPLSFLASSAITYNTWVGLVFGSSFVRINLHYFAIYAHIFPIKLGFGLFGFDCRFTHFEPSVRRKDVDLRPNQVKRASKTSPIGLRWVIQGNMVHHH